MITSNDPLFSVENKICIVTGGMGQLGAQFSKALWERGARVAVWGRHVPQEKIEKIYTKEQYTSDRLKFYTVDITSKESLNKALDEMEQAWGGAPDVLVNNAGIDTQDRKSVV